MTWLVEGLGIIIISVILVLILSEAVDMFNKE